MEIDSTDRLTGVVMALAAGAVFAVFAPWITGHAAAVAWPGWWTDWAREDTWLALRTWDALLVSGCWVLPGAALAWLIVRVGRLPDWRYAWLAPLPVVAWMFALPALEGRDLHLAERFESGPVAFVLGLAALLLSIPFFAWLFRRRG